MLKGECKNLFLEVRDFTDRVDAMQDFVELLEKWVDWNKGDIRIALIDLNEHGFPIGDIFIAYDDMSGSGSTTIYSPLDFVKLIIDTLNEYDDEKYLEDFWIPRLKEFINYHDY